MTSQSFDSLHIQGEDMDLYINPLSSQNMGKVISKLCSAELSIW